ncbi:hypothetical protein V1477_013200 [Vespula maculifrons]|uniref:ParB/Sulfiredoxin domain-containing protein n=1 Tax=Vespula maculifrons TaxID=7453 RepID=A0ABD2BV85_VESMC
MLVREGKEKKEYVIVEEKKHFWLMEGEHRLYRAIDNLVELDYINPPSQIHTEAPNERSTEEHLGKLMAKSSIIIWNVH